MTEYPRPVGPHLFVKLLDAEDETRATGLIVPATAVKAPQPDRGIVTKVGPGYRDWAGTHYPLDFSVGDEVLFYKERTYEIALPTPSGENETLYLVHDEAVLVILDRALDPVTDRAQ